MKRAKLIYLVQVRLWLETDVGAREPGVLSVEESGHGSCGTQCSFMTQIGYFSLITLKHGALNDTAVRPMS